MEEKRYKISKTRSNTDKEEIVEGTLPELMEVFGCVLKAANMGNPKIKTDPKNIKEFMTALQKSYNFLEKVISSSTFVDLVK